jgi:predicted nucleic acid-binding Zn ribbon protein
VSTWRPAKPLRGTRQATPISASLAGEVRRLGGPDAALTGLVFGHWEEVVGPNVADHSRPRGLRDGILTVEVDEPAWATQLRWLGPQVVARIAELAGGPQVTELVVRVVGDRPPRRAAAEGRAAPGEAPAGPPARRR